MNYEWIQFILTNVTTVILSLVSELYFLSAFFQRKQTKLYTNFIVYSIFSLLFFVTLQFVENRALNLFLLTVCTVLITCLMSTRWVNRILFSLLFLVFSTISEFFIALITQLLFSIKFDDLREGSMHLVGMLLSKFLALVVFAMLHMVKHHALSGKQSKYWSILFLLPATTLFTALVLLIPMDSNINDRTRICFLIVLIGLIVCNLYVFRFIEMIQQSADAERRLAVADNLLKEQERQYSLMVEKHEEVAKIQHDYKNILLGIQSELIGERYTEAVRQIQSQLSLVSLSSSAISGNPTIDTIVKAKMDIAKAHNIIIDFQFRNIQKLRIDNIDLSILLGNALDNAIEATCKVQASDRKTITLLVVLKDNTLNIVIKNPVENPVDADHLVTDKSDKHLHGYGIINMRTIVDRYDGSLFFTCKDLSFGTTVLLPNQKPIQPKRQSR